MLLKVSSQLHWTFMDKSNELFKKFMTILIQISQQQKSEEDKTKVYWEKALMDSWERLIDKEEDKNHDFFVLRENFLKEIKALASNGETQLKAEVQQQENKTF